MKQGNRFSKVFTRAQLEAGVNCVADPKTGRGYALAISSDNLAYNSVGNLLLNTSLGMAETAAEVQDILSLPRLTKAEMDSAGLTELYNAAAITISVRGKVQAEIERRHEQGDRSFALNIIGLTLAGNRVDQTTGTAIEGKYLFNTTPNGITLFEIDPSNFESTKPAGEAETSIVRASAPAPVRDWGSIKAKLAAMNATANVNKPEPPAASAPKVSVLAIGGRMKALGLDAAGAKAIAEHITPEDWTELSAAKDAAEFKGMLDLIGVKLA